MSKISLTNLVNLQNETTAVNAINANNAVLTTALNNTLSRDGSSPNPMNAALDMNSNRIVNLPAAISANEPVRLTELNTLVSGGSLTFNSLPTGGTTGQQLTKNSATNYDASWSTSPSLRAANPTNLYVATSGSDSNNGLSIGSPFLTIQHAVNVALQNYDFQGSNLTINVGTGTFAGATVAGPCPGGGGAAALVILGNGASNTIVNTTVIATSFANLKIGSFKIQVSSGSDILSANNSIITLADGGMNFGPAITAIVDVLNGSAFYGSSNFGFTISGGAQAAFLISTNSNVQLSVGATYTITGNPNFPNGFVNAVDGCGFNPGITSVFSGSATGPTYNMSLNCWVDMEQNLNPLPGSTAGILNYGSSYYGAPAAQAIGVGTSLLTLNNSTTITAQSSGVATWSGGTLSGVAVGQLPATATNDNATAGNSGEYIESVVAAGSAVALVTATGKDVTTITLTAGDWDVTGSVAYIPAASTSTTGFSGSISLVANTQDSTNGRFYSLPVNATVSGGNHFSLPIQPCRFSVSGSTVIHLVAVSSFTVSTMSAYGMIRARRMR